MRKVVIGVLTTSVLLLMGGLRVVDLHQSRADTLRAAETRAANLAHILSEYVGEAFAAADAVLRQLAHHSRRVGGPAADDRDWTPSLASARVGISGIGSVSVVDVDGIIRHSTRPDLVGQSRHDESIYQQALRVPGDGLIVGTPFASVNPPRGFVIPIGRRLTREDGTIDGAVVASFIPADLRRFFGSIGVGPQGILWVFHRDGVILFREPSPADPIGESASENPLFRAASQNGAGTLHGPVAPGGPVMLSAFHARSDQPLIVAVSLDRDQVLAAWRREVNGSAIAFGVAAVLLVVTLFVLYRQIDQKAAAERALEQARQREAERLFETNQQLAATLDREQMARREAENANALKDQFVMAVSHELRTPLTAIAGWSRLLVDGLVDESKKEAALRTIERNARAQTRLIDDLLDVSGTMSGRMRLDVRIVQIEEVVKNALEAVAPAIDAKAIRLETSLDSAAGTIAGDPERLQQVVFNLLSNAVKFTPDGGTVRVSLARLGDEVEIAVSDTGAGISPDFLPHVFERFRQQHAGTSRRHGGLGLGLAIVRNLVELHGGTVTADSDGEGRGAMFKVRLPAMKKADT
jgi:signal transduction histidine kinase